MNLLKETTEVIEKNGYKTSDILWIGCKDFYCDWEHFSNIISQIEYDDGFGIEEIATDLIIAGKDWWLERHEYDGSEWWEFKKPPEKPLKKYNFMYVSRNQFNNYYGIDMELAKMNKDSL